MSNPDDDRTAQQREPDATAQWSRDAGSNPDQRTEQFPGAQPSYTTDPTQAYGPVANPTQAYPTYPGADATQAYGQPSNPTQAYPTQAYGQPSDQTQAYGQPSNPTQAYPTYPGADPTQAYGQPSNPTQAYPTYPGADATQAYGQPSNPTQAYPGPGYEQNQWQGPPGPPTGQVPVPPEGDPKGPSKGVLIAAFTVAGLLVAAVVGFGVMLFSGNSDQSPSASGPATTTTAPRATTTPPRATTTTTTPSPQATEAPDLSKIPGGIGEALQGAGGTVGTVDSNDDGTLILDGIGGSKVTVTTTPDTKLISLTAKKVKDLAPGEMVVVQGDTGPDGTVVARVIIGTSLPDLGTFGN
ncbi:DUF5666 domain-containing protein [Rhodococcus kronopolitis]|uniref:DUF5666 domain-containing protein n=1 Tax=Rhodococcus kronopolitis TaxID=1460226 RepID=A0ABV9FUK4_9NOCA